MKFPTSRVVFNMPIGPIPDSAMAGRSLTAAAAFARPLRPRVDAIVLDADRVTLIEAENWELRRAISDLAFYAPLIPLTPELEPFRSAELVLLAVVPEKPDWFDAVASAHGITVDLYAPDWLADIVHRNANYHTREYREKREARRDALDRLGLS